MKKRKAFKLTWALVPYNLAMACLNAYIAIQVSIPFLASGNKKISRIVSFIPMYPLSLDESALPLHRYLFISFTVIRSIHEITIQLRVSANKTSHASWWTSGKRNFSETEKEKFLFYIFFSFQAGLKIFYLKQKSVFFSFFIEINYELIEKLLSHVGSREKVIKKYWNVFRLLTRFGGTTLASFWNSATHSFSSCGRRIISWASFTFIITPPCSRCGGSVSNGYRADLVSLTYFSLHQY